MPSGTPDALIAARFEPAATNEAIAIDRSDGRAVTLAFRDAPASGLHELGVRMKRALRLEHPRIARVRAFVRDGERLVVATEAIAGTPLQPPLSSDGVRALARDLCAALGAAHDARIVHGRLTARSIAFVDGAATIVDLGEAQLHAPPDELDERDDVRAVGALLYEAATGKPPFEAPASDLDAELRAPILRCLQKDPARRFGGVGELGVALGVTLRAPTERPRRRRLVPGVALVAAACVAGAASVVVATRLPRTRRVVASGAVPTVAAPAVAPAKNAPRVVFGIPDAQVTNAAPWLAKGVPEMLRAALDESNKIEVRRVPARFGYEVEVTVDGKTASVRVLDRTSDAGTTVLAEEVPIDVYAIGEVAANIRALVDRAASESLVDLTTPNLDAWRTWIQGDAAKACDLAPTFWQACAPAGRGTKEMAAHAGDRGVMELTSAGPEPGLLFKRFPGDARVASNEVAIAIAVHDLDRCVTAALQAIDDGAPEWAHLVMCLADSGWIDDAQDEAAKSGDPLLVGDVALLRARWSDARAAYALAGDPIRARLVALWADGKCRAPSATAKNPEDERALATLAYACDDGPAPPARAAMPGDQLFLFDAPPVFLHAIGHADADPDGAEAECGALDEHEPLATYCLGRVAEARRQWGAAYDAYRAFIDDWSDGDGANRWLADAKIRIVTVVHASREPAPTTQP